MTLTPSLLEHVHTATTPRTPTVIGLDTSLTATGIASSTGWSRTVGYTDNKHPITKLPHAARIDAMRGVRKGIVANLGRPHLVVMEAPSLASKGGGGHERGWLWWSVYEYLATAEIPVALLTPSQRALYATGKGNADKRAVIDQAARRWPTWDTRGDDNQVDALVLMAAGMDWLGYPLAEMPKGHRAALDKTVWPEVVL